MGNYCCCGGLREKCAGGGSLCCGKDKGPKKKKKKASEVTLYKDWKDPKQFRTSLQKQQWDTLPFSQVVDTSTAVSFEGKGTGSFVQFDAREPVNFVQTSVFKSRDGDCWEIQYSDDGSHWATVATTPELKQETWNVVKWTSEGPHRYWRYVMTKYKNGYFYNGFRWYVEKSSDMSGDK